MNPGVDSLPLNFCSKQTINNKDRDFCSQQTINNKDRKDEKNKNKENGNIIEKHIEEFISDLLLKTFEDRKIISNELKILIKPLGFEIYLPHGEKTLANGVKRTIFLCNNPKKSKNTVNTQNQQEINNDKVFEYRSDCPFYLQFTTDLTGKNYSLTTYVIQHNHPLITTNEMKSINKMSTPIKTTIKDLAGKLKTTKELTEYVNKQHNIKANYHQIYYQENKSYAEEYGNFKDDAKMLLEVCEEDLHLHLGKYKHCLNTDNQLVNFIYSSKEMEEVYRRFNDLLIIDTTFKKNRFNMPMINFVNIDEYGFSKVVAFGFISNEKEESFDWILEQFHGFMTLKPPKIIYTDEDDA